MFCYVKRRPGIKPLFPARRVCTAANPALRYLLFALLGSILYLFGRVLFYGAYGTLDIVMLSGRVQAQPVTWAAVALMTAGLLAKAALYPFQLWLPPAHAGASAPVSAILSGLVVQAPFFLVVRLWFDVIPELPQQAATQILGTLGAAAILFGSVVALRQARWAQAAHRLLDCGADRVAVPGVPARHHTGNGPSLKHVRVDDP